MKRESEELSKFRELIASTIDFLVKRGRSVDIYEGHHNISPHWQGYLALAQGFDVCYSPEHGLAVVEWGLALPDVETPEQVLEAVKNFVERNP